MSKFERIFEKVMEAQKKFETTHLHVSVDFTIDDLKDALIETNGIIAEKDKEIAELKSKLEDLQNTYKESVEIKSQIWERCKKAEADASETQALLEERNKQVGELKDEIRNLKRSLIVARHEVVKARGKNFSNKYRENRAKLKEY